MSLRTLCEKDLAMVLEWRNSPAIRENMYTSHEISMDEHQAWYQQMKDNPAMLWFVHENEKGTPDGVVYFYDYKPLNCSSFWGFYAAPDAKRGTGTRMELEALDMAFIELSLHKLNCEVLASNRPVVKLHEKFGFTREGLFRDYHFDGNSFEDVIRLGMLSVEWNEKRPEMVTRIEKR